MFRWKIVSFLCFVTVGAFFMGQHMAQVSPQDREQYFRLLESSQMTEESALKTLCETRQRRKNIQKDIWAVQAGKPRLHLRILADRGALTLSYNLGKIEAEEHLEELRCWIQEKCLESSGQIHNRGPLQLRQKLQYLESNTGVYSYQKQALNAEKVSLWQYNLPGHDWISEPLEEEAELSGDASRIHFYFDENSPSFRAYKVRATLQTPEDIL